jgi:hypothetical protein
LLSCFLGLAGADLRRSTFTFLVGDSPSAGSSALRLRPTVRGVALVAAALTLAGVFLVLLGVLGDLVGDLAGDLARLATVFLGVLVAAFFAGVFLAGEAERDLEGDLAGDEERDLEGDLVVFLVEVLLEVLAAAFLPGVFLGGRPGRLLVALRSGDAELLPSS